MDLLIPSVIQQPLYVVGISMQKVVKQLQTGQDTNYFIMQV